jgi:hypothetical protein
MVMTAQLKKALYPMVLEAELMEQMLQDAKGQRGLSS